MRVDELEQLLDRLAARAAGGRSSSTRCPSFQNPAGVTMSEPRRRRLVELARERELLLVEDNPYGLLRYEGEPREPLYELDGGDFVLYVGTFSKILSPGIRLGWLCAPPPVMEKVVLGKQASDLCTSTLTQYFVREYFAEGHWLDYVGDLCGIYRERRDAMLDALERFFPDRGDLVAARGRAVLLGDAARLHRHHRPAREGAARERRLRPRRRRLRRRARRLLDAAQLLGLRRGRDPRGDPPDRRRDRRADGRSTSRLPGSTNASSAATRRRPDGEPRSSGGSVSGGSDEGRGAQGRPGPRAPGVAAQRRPGRGRARVARPRGAADRRRRRPRRDAEGRAARGRLRRPARPRRRGRHRPGAARDPAASRTPGPASAPACARSTRSPPSTSCAPPASRRPTGRRSTRSPSASSAPPRRWRRSRRTSASRW